MELKKIDLVSVEEQKVSDNDSTTIPAMSKRRKLKFKFKKKPHGIILIVVLVLLLLSAFFIGLPLQKVYISAQKTYKQAKIATDYLKKQNVEVGSVELKKTKDDLAVTQKELEGLSYLRFIPLLGGYYNDAAHLAKASSYALDASIVLVESVKPYADVLGLKGQGSFVMGSAEQRIQTAILTMGKITPRIDDVAASFSKAKQEIDQVDPNHYPDIGPSSKVRKQLILVRTLADEGVVFVEQARPLIKVLPSLMGESKTKKYLVLFQNDKELRPTGGFITAYAIFRIDKGVINAEKSEDIYSLDGSVPNKPKAPDVITKYLPNVSVLNLRDSNLSPDFEQSMKTFRDMYESASSKVPVDGIIAIDTNVLVSTIKILDDKVEAGGLTFTTKEDQRCHCPQVIYALEDNISRPVNYIKADRKGLLGQLLYAIMQKSLKSSPKLYWGPLLQNMITEVNQKHVLFALDNQDAQQGLRALNAVGQIKPYDGDYLHINQANFGGQKANLFTTETVKQDITVNSDRTITKTITISYKNPYPPSDCNLERGNLCLNATLRDVVRIYVPKGSELLDSKGSQVQVTTSEDLGKTVFEGFLEVRPLGSATYMAKYKLPFKLANDSVLPLLIQKQPGTDANEYTINVNGGLFKKFPLVTDMEFKIKP